MNPGWLLFGLALACAVDAGTLNTSAGDVSVEHTSAKHASADHASTGDPETRFGWAWTLEPAEPAAAYRLRLNPEVYAALVRADAGDWLITDSGGRPVPVARVPREALTEPLAERLPVQFEAAVAELNAGDTAAPLEMELRLGETRVLLRAPPGARSGDHGDRLVYEALLAAPQVPPEMPQRTLVFRFQSDARAEFDCRLRRTDEPAPRRDRLVLQSEGDTRPRRYTATFDFERLPPGWHLACYGDALPDGFDLRALHVYARGRRDHQRWLTLEPRAVAESGGYVFGLDGPYRVRQLIVGADQPNLLSEIRVLSRADERQPWRKRAVGTLSTLHERDPAAELAVSGPHRDRYWRLQAEPPLPDPPHIRVQAEAEEILFLAQGEPPWILYAGSARAEPDQPVTALVDDTARRLGPAWSWQPVEPQQRREAAGTRALQPPHEPIDWPRHLLWLVLIVGAAAVTVLSVKLLRRPAS